MATQVNNIVLDDEVYKVPWSKIVQVTATGEDPTSLFLKTDYNSESRRLDLNRHKKRVRAGENFVDVREVQLVMTNSKPGISKAKKNDLIALLDDRQIPPSYRDYFVSLPVNGNSSDNEAVDSSEEEN